MIDPHSKQASRLITIVSIAIPVAVAALFAIKIPGVDLSFLPPIYAFINGLTAVLLFYALLAIKQKRRKLHEILIKICMVLSILFLLCYVAYHITSDTTAYEGSAPILYFFVLVSHITLSVLVIPLVLFAYLHAWRGDFEKHKRWTRIAWPIWFYVAISGVVVYKMISPFYQ